MKHELLSNDKFSRYLSMSDRFLSFLISTSLFLAISGSFKVLVSSLLYNSGLLNNAITLNITVITFLATFGTYGLNKLTDIKEDTINTPERANIIKKIEVIFKYSVAISFVFSLLLGYLVNVLTLPVLLFPLFLGILYSVRLSGNLPRLKDITGVKNLTIALSWAAGSTFLPAIFLIEKKMSRFC